MSKARVAPATAKAPLPVAAAKKLAIPKPTAPARAASKRDAVEVSVKQSRVAESPKPAKVVKQRLKPVRDSFTMPVDDFALIAALKARLLAAKHAAKKSELLRAGLHALAAMETPALVAALGKLDQVKVGRPKKGH